MRSASSQPQSWLAGARGRVRRPDPPARAAFCTPRLPALLGGCGQAAVHACGLGQCDTASRGGLWGCERAAALSGPCGLLRPHTTAAAAPSNHRLLWVHADPAPADAAPRTHQHDHLVPSQQAADAAQRIDLLQLVADLGICLRSAATPAGWVFFQRLPRGGSGSARGPPHAPSLQNPGTAAGHRRCRPPLGWPRLGRRVGAMRRRRSRASPIGARGAGVGGRAPRLAPEW